MTTCPRCTKPAVILYNGQCSVCLSNRERIERMGGK